jgi:uncharacterized protein (TIGR03437 family)
MAIFVSLALVLLSCGRLASGQTILFTNNTLPQPYEVPLALGPKGIYLAGAVYDPQSAAGPEGSQSVLAKYDVSGKQLWSRQAAEPRGVFPRVIAAGDAAVYMGGVTGFFVNYKAFVRKYDEAGNELWFRQFPVGTTQDQYTSTRGLAVDASGVYVSATNGTSVFQGAEGWLRKLSPAGDEIWSRTLKGSSPGALTVDVTSLYVTGVNDEGGFVSRYTPEGDELWRHQFDKSVDPGMEIYVPLAVVTDATGIYVGGEIGIRFAEGVEPRSDGFLLKLDAGGNELWTHRFGGSGGRIDAIALDASGVYGGGTTLSALPGQCRAGSRDAFVRKYDPEGNELWTRQFGTVFTESVAGTGVDSTGVYISGGAYGPGGIGGASFLTKISKAPPVVDRARPYLSTECVLNAANNLGGGVAPGEIVTVYGGAMGTAELTIGRVEDGRFTTMLDSARILFDGVAAPLLYSSAGQSSAVVPYGVSGKQSVSVQVEYRGEVSDPLVVPVFRSRPAVFTRNGSGAGQAIILNEDGSPNSPENPAARGSVLTMYMTGLGLTSPSLTDGTIVGSLLPGPTMPLTVVFGDPADPLGEDVLTAEIISARGVSGAVVGLFEVKFRVPAMAATGSAVPIVFWQNGQVDQVQYGDSTATVALR